MGSSSEIIDIATSARRIGVDNRISLKFYFRIADNILKQANIFRAEKNVIDLYVMLLRFSSLALETIPSHRDYRTSLKSNKEYLRMRLLDVLTELEKLKPVVQQRIDELYPKLKPRFNVQAHPANGSVGWSSAMKPSLNSYDHAKTVESEKLLKPILSPEEAPVFVHGTYKKNLESILSSGLKRMNRLHVHFSCGLPTDGDVVSGMRRNVNVLIFLDIKKALEDGIGFAFNILDNKVILTEGIDGVVPVDYFLKIESWPDRQPIPF